MDWDSVIDDTLLEHFLQTGFMVLDGCFDGALVQNLQTESGFVAYKKASLTHGETLAHIRGDHIRWIDDTCPYGAYYSEQLLALGKWFNRILFTTIRQVESHYACYPVGFGYDWHKDNPKGRDERVFSAVYYLNDDWKDSDGGAICLVDKMGKNQTLLPKANRLVVFDSNLLHQVAITHRIRYSIASWLRRDG